MEDREKTREDVQVEPWRRGHQMLEGVRRAQEEFILGASRRRVFEHLLSALLAAADSEYGFIGEMLHTDDGKPYLKTHALTNIAWNEETRRYYEENAPAGIDFFNMRTLIGEVLTTGRTVFANDPARHPSRGGLPPGHPPMYAFLGVPVHRGERTIGMAGLANRPGGYDEEVEIFLQSLVATCASFIEAYQRDRERRESEERAITALPAPILQVGEGVIAMPIVGSIDAARAAQITETLLGEIVRLKARHTLLDLTGVSSVDTATANHLLGVVRAASQRGSACAISGITPHVTDTMVGLGIGAEGFASFGTLEDALKHAFEGTLAGAGAGAGRGARG